MSQQPDVQKQSLPDPSWAKMDPVWVMEYIRDGSKFDADKIEQMLQFAIDAAKNCQTGQLHFVQDSPEVIDSARALIAAMAGELRKIIARRSDTAQLDLARETAGVSGHLNALQLHGLLSIEKYNELVAEKVAAARNIGI